MVRPLRFAFTPTHSREAMYRELVECVSPQVDVFITVAHGPLAQLYAQGVVVPFDGDPDLSAMWNLGFDKAAELAGGHPYYVACLNDDALVGPDWFDRMVDAIEVEGTAGASTPRAPGKAASIFGGAFVVTPGIRLSGVLRWYFTDDEIQKLCERAGGFSIVPGVHAVNRHADRNFKQSPYLQQVSAEDGPKFHAMYGVAASPWGNTQWPAVVAGDAERVTDPRTILPVSGDDPLEHLAAGMAAFDRFIYLPANVTPKLGFWEAVDSEEGPCWLFGDGFAGIFHAATLARLWGTDFRQTLPPRVIWPTPDLDLVDL